MSLSYPVKLKEINVELLHFYVQNIIWLLCILLCIINAKYNYWLFDLKKTAEYQSTRLLV